MGDNSETARDVTASPSEESTLAMQNICLDFALRQDRYWDKLLQFLDEHQEPLGLGQTGDPVQAYLERVWPNTLPCTLIITNISRLKHSLWLIRPPVDGPLAASFAARGLAPAFRVYRKQGTLIVVGVEIVPHIKPRPFETQATGVMYINSATELMTPADLDSLEALPRHRQDMEKRLADWRKYLDWRNKLAHLGQVALAYDRFEINKDGEIVFSIRGTHPIEALGQRLGQTSLIAAPASASETQNRWNPPPDKRPQFVPAGRAIAVEPRNNRASDRSLGLGRHDHYPQTGNTREVPVVIATEFDDQAQAEELIAGLPENGFLLANIGGDLKPIAQERGGIERLCTGQGHNPYLLNWLFDAKNAAVPEAILDAAADLLKKAHLNREQIEAINKSLAACDLSLIHGPPGTGKTWVIAWLCYCIVVNGGRVLLASQTNLAVDNVLSHLPNWPGLRPLRIAKADRVDDASKEFLGDRALKRWLTLVAQRTQELIQQYQAQRDAIRTAQRGFEILQQILAQTIAVAQETVPLENRQAELSQQRNDQTTILDNLQQRTEDGARQHRAAVELLHWLDAPKANPPAADALETSDIAEQFRRVADQLSSGVKDHRWVLPWLTSPEPSLLANCLLRIHLVWRSLGAADQLQTASVEMTALTQGMHGCEDLPQARRLRELQNQRRTLVESDSEEDLRQLARINREIKSLRQDRWSCACQAILIPLRTIFDDQLPEDLDELTSSLQPDARHQGVLEDLRTFGGDLKNWVGTSVAAQLSVLQAQVMAEASRLQVDQDACNHAMGESRQQLAEIESQLDQVKSQIESLGNRRQEYRNRWAEVWPDVCIDLQNATQESTPDEQVLNARQATFNTWLEQHSAETQRGERWQVVQEEWVHRLNQPVEAQRERLKRLYVQKANVVGMTCYEAGQLDFHQDPGFQPFDAVILDEASKITPPEFLLPALLGRRIIVVADPRQLAPMYREHESSYEEAVAEGLLAPEDFRQHKNLVTSSFFQSLFESAPEALKQILRVQYRMHPQIMAVVNLFYEGRLIAGPSEQELDRGRQHHLRIRDKQGGWLLEPHQHLLWIDSSCNCHGIAAFETQCGTSKSNPLEADMVVATLLLLNPALKDCGYSHHHKAVASAAEQGWALQHWVERVLKNTSPETVRDLFSRGQVKANGTSGVAGNLIQAGDVLEVDARKSVGVITFYGAQLGEIRQRLAKVLKDSPDAFSAMDLRTNTVDRFQGMEQAIVLVSMVRSVRNLRGGEYVKQYQRINVAFSRAQELLVIIGAERTFRNVMVDLPPMDGGVSRKAAVYRDSYEIVKRYGGRRYARQLLG